MRRVLLTWVLVLGIWGQPLAYEVAPRITDREIVERLTRLEAKLSELEDRLQEGLNALNKRIDDVNRRIDELHSTMLALFSVLIALMAAFVGFVFWDRRSVLRPVQRQMQGVIEALRILARRDEEVAEILRAYGLL